jgi:hypothetical protein
MDVNFIHRLEKRLYNDLPGEAISKYDGTNVGSDKYRDIAPDHKTACVIGSFISKR